MIAGETRIVLLIINVTPAKNGAKIARPSAVLELLKITSEVATMTTILPNTRRRPG